MQRSDEAIRAFLKYARFGFDRRGLSSLEAARRFRGCSSSDAEALRLLCVYDMLRVLEAQGKEEYAEAVRAVYFSRLGRTPRKNDIVFAVRRFALANHMDERTVWRKIEYAKALYNSLLQGQMQSLSPITDRKEDRDENNT